MSVWCKGDIIRSMRGIAETGATPFLSPMLEDDPAAAASSACDREDATQPAQQVDPETISV